MKLSSPAIVLDVPDTDASRDFLQEHLGFEVTAAGDGFTALGHENHDLRIIVRPLAAGQAPQDMRQLQIGFLVSGIDSHWADLKDRVTITDPIQTLQKIGERSFQIADGNGVSYRLIQFV